MDLVRRASRQLEQRMSIADMDRWMDMAQTGTPTYTGKLVSQQNALQVSAVWACIRIRANDIARLPLIPYRRLNPGLQPATDHYLWSLCQHEANPRQTAFRFRHQMQTWLDLAGNSYAEIEMNGRGQVTGLWPWRPDRVKIFRVDKSLESPLIYRYTFDDQTKVDLPGDHILHLRGLGLDGITGLSPIETHKQTVGYSMAITEHGARFFSNGARPLGVLEYPGVLNDKSRKNLEESFANSHQGLSNAHRIAVLEEGAKFNEVGSTMVDAQYLEQMKFTIEDFSRIYGVPLHRLSSLDQATNNNIEQQDKNYIDDCLGPLANNWEQEMEFALLSERDRDQYCVRFKLRNLMRGDMAAQAAFYGALTDRGDMTQNEVREDLEMNPLPGKLANIPWKNAAMIPASDDTYAPPAQQQKQTEPDPGAPAPKPKQIPAPKPKRKQ